MTPSLPHTGLNWGGAGQSHPSREPLPSTTDGVASSPADAWVTGLGDLVIESDLQDGRSNASQNCALPLTKTLSTRTAWGNYTVIVARHYILVWGRKMAIPKAQEHKKILSVEWKLSYFEELRSSQKSKAILRFGSEIKDGKTSQTCELHWSDPKPYQIANSLLAGLKFRDFIIWSVLWSIVRCSIVRQSSHTLIR